VDQRSLHAVAVHLGDDLRQRLAGGLRRFRPARAALAPGEDVAVVVEAVARQRRQQLRIALADAVPGGAKWNSMTTKR
jgi:hypothetical protein